ncbi:MAG: hypothetical protein R2932_30845 [Caldilineaceae bacterium]
MEYNRRHRHHERSGHKAQKIVSNPVATTGLVAACCRQRGEAPEPRTASATLTSDEADPAPPTDAKAAAGKLSTEQIDQPASIAGSPNTSLCQTVRYRAARNCGGARAAAPFRRRRSEAHRCVQASAVSGRCAPPAHGVGAVDV